MANPTHVTSGAHSWSFATNWAISGGSPYTSVKLFSSPETPSRVDSSGPAPSRVPLVLNPTSASSGPCEIKISFMQKHEIRKIYIRSTAHVYEIYCASALQKNDVHRCTVHCSIAKGEDLLHTIDNEEDEKAISANLKVFNEEQAHEKVALESEIDHSEDDWLEVEMPAPRLDKVFYEATAKITDADPCISFTLCLLSSQSKASLYIDEIHVFADPLILADSESKAAQVENSVGCTLMAAPAPTLSQLSISDFDCVQDEQASATVEKEETGLRTLESTKTGNEVPSNGTCNTCDQQSQLQTEAHASDREGKYDLPSCQAEWELKQLTLQIARMEDLFLKLEDALKPIVSMEARLQRVEALMESLAKSPAFLPTELNARAIYNDGKDYPPRSTPELESNDPASSRIHKAADGTSISASVSQFVPCLVAKAPVFSCDEDEEETGASEPSKNFHRENMKRNSSANNVLDDTFTSFTKSIPTASCNPDISATVPIGDGAGFPGGLLPPPYTHWSQMFASDFISRPFDNFRDPLGLQRIEYVSRLQQQLAQFRDRNLVQPRQQALEAHVGAFGPPRKLDGCHQVPGSVATSGKPWGSGFVSYQSNGFSNSAAQGGDFSTLASGGEFNKYAPPLFGESSAFAMDRGLNTAASTSYGIPDAASSSGFLGAATSWGLPTAASGSKSELPGQHGVFGNRGERGALRMAGENAGTGLPPSRFSQARK